MTATTLADAGKTVSRKMNATADALIDEAAAKADAVVAKVGARAHKISGGAADEVQDLGKALQSYVQDKPFAALGASALAGFLFAVLFVRRVPKTIYVKPSAH